MEAVRINERALTNEEHAGYVGISISDEQRACHAMCQMRDR